MLIFIFGGAAIVTTPTGILPEINIPIVSVIWTYNGLDADGTSKRIVGICERALGPTVNNIKSTQSQSYTGVGVIKVYFQPNVQIDLAIAQVTALAQSILRQLPPGVLPPQILKYDASSVPIVQLRLGGKNLSQQQFFDLGQNFIRPPRGTTFSLDCHRAVFGRRPCTSFRPQSAGAIRMIRRDPSNAIVTPASATGGDTTITNNTPGNTIAVKGFSTGASIQLGINNFLESFYSGRSSAVPFTHPRCNRSYCPTTASWRWSEKQYPLHCHSQDQH